MTLPTASLPSPSAPLHALARRAGLQPHWLDAWGRPQQVADAALRRLLQGLALACDTPAQCQASCAWLDAGDAARGLPALITADQGQPVAVPWPDGTDARPYRIELEDGSRLDGTAEPAGDGMLRLAPVAACGYHRLHIGDAQAVLAVAPQRCFGVDDALRTAGRASDHTADPTADRAAARARAWGLAVQLYGLRRGAPTGMGDLSALAQCCQAAAGEHADAVAINPLHAGFAALPERYSPYSPSSRLFHNPLYADPAAVFGQDAVDSAIAALNAGAAFAQHEARSEIDWPELSRLRLSVLRWLWEHRGQLLPPAALDACAAFRARGGTALHDHACYEAIQASRLGAAANGMNASGAADWRCWPVTLRSPADPAVAAFAMTHAQEIDYHVFLQWLADDGRARAQQAARDAGMAIGVIADLAVGADPGGSQAWSRQQDILDGFHAGAPPDVYNPHGQDWGVSVFSPRSLHQHGYGAFIEMLRANLAHAGGLRIDHVLGLARMWLVPAGASARDGAYLDFPLQVLLRLVALESWRHRAIIIGENLGTVPPHLDSALAARGVLGIDVLWFARAEPAPPAPPEAAATAPDALAAVAPADAAPFLRAEDWPRHAVATTSTHDLPTVAGWWRGQDLAWRERLGLLAPAETPQDVRAARVRERTALWQALCDAGLAGGDLPGPEHPPLDAVLAWLGRTRTPLCLLPLEDLLGAAEQANLPGTTAGHPNWQRRLDADVRRLFDTPDLRARARAVRQGRLPGAPRAR
ncbi:4-alpha-glucanotransferase [Cupriavidus yeoncheonensis]|uniref:4-alpha-glucanotransferase n=1 Tax=Cupriavidus yeoncheonensis TaxID=1462994 RepID=A0A916IVE1_9BURK|nr:4-alpha-glucanotransferase [Cupriavidus yeoncheonensis]CAG2146858.1 4-alpha-glucanotransferase [Cupriavidus yeoncheonensis]